MRPDPPCGYNPCCEPPRTSQVLIPADKLSLETLTTICRDLVNVADKETLLKILPILIAEQP